MQLTNTNTVDRINRSRLLVLGALIAICMVSQAATQSFATDAPVANGGAASPIEQEIRAAEKKLKDVGAKSDYAGVADMYSDDLTDIHGSGWAYTKQQTIELNKNTALIWPPVGRLAGVPMEGRKVILSRIIGETIHVYGKDTAIVSGIGETYFETPNPEDIAIAAGTLTRSPEATAKAIADRNPANTLGPAETASPNPYRVRYSRVWVRQAGQWKLALSQQTRIDNRTGRVTIR